LEDILVILKNQGAFKQNGNVKDLLTGIDRLDPGSYSIWAIGLRSDDCNRTQAAAAATVPVSGGAEAVLQRAGSIWG
jgi:hypothetical protein